MTTSSRDIVVIGDCYVDVVAAGVRLSLLSVLSLLFNNVKRKTLKYVQESPV